jgi:hypothetical protein
MSDFPQRWIQLRREWDLQRRAQRLFVGGQQGQGALTRRQQSREQRLPIAFAGGVGRCPLPGWFHHPGSPR